MLKIPSLINKLFPHFGTRVSVPIESFDSGHHSNIISMSGKVLQVHAQVCFVPNSLSNFAELELTQILVVTFFEYGRILPFVNL